MTKEIDISKLENPYIQVVWEDVNENFTQDRIKSVKHYFQKKYNTTNVNVITKVKTAQGETEQTIDVSVNIMDTNYQVELLKQYLNGKGYDDYLDSILSHNNMVENKMRENETETTIFKKWYIDGRLYYHKVIDLKNPQEGIKELRYIDPMKMRFVRQEKKQDNNVIGPNIAGRDEQKNGIAPEIEEYFVYTPNISFLPR